MLDPTFYGCDGTLGGRAHAAASGLVKPLRPTDRPPGRPRGMEMERRESGTVEQSQLFRTAAPAPARASCPIPTDKSPDCDRKKEEEEERVREGEGKTEDEWKGQRRADIKERRRRQRPIAT